MLSTSLLLALGGAVIAAGGVVLYTSGPLADWRNDSSKHETVDPTTEAVSEELADVVTRTVPNGLPARPSGLAVGGDGTLYLSSCDGHQVFRVRPGMPADVVAGTGSAGIADGPALTAEFECPGSILLSPAGDLFLTDGVAHRIRKVTSTGEVITFAGGGATGLGQGGFADGPGDQARFNLPAGIALAPDGSLVVADKDNNRIRRITPDGTVTTVAGTGVHGATDGEGVRATFSAPVGIAVDADGTIYVTEHGNNSVRRISPDGRVSTILKTIPGPFAGTPAASTLNLSYPSSIAILPGGSLLVADTQAHRLVVLQLTGAARVVAGDGVSGQQDGRGANARLFLPRALQPVGNGSTFLLLDGGSATIREVVLR